MTLIYYFKIEYIMGFNNIKFISNNVRAIKNSDKRIKIFEYLKKKVNSNGVLFLQEKHSCEKDEKKWNDGFKGTLFFLHGTTNSCGVAIGYSRANSFILEERKTDKTGRLLLLDITIHPVEVPRWSSNFVPGIKTDFEEFS